MKDKPATHEISACYFPVRGEVDLTWKNLENGKRAFLTAKVSEEEGQQIANTVWACVYWDAKAVPQVKESDNGDVGDFLWCEFMDWCKNRRENPANHNELFSIVRHARERFPNQQKVEVPTLEERPWKEYKYDPDWRYAPESEHAFVDVKLIDPPRTFTKRRVDSLNWGENTVAYRLSYPTLKESSEAALKLIEKSFVSPSENELTIMDNLRRALEE